MASTEAASSAGYAGADVPSSAASERAFSGVRFHTPASMPARWRLRAMWEPMAPRPMNPTRMMTPLLTTRANYRGSARQVLAPERGVLSRVGSGAAGLLARVQQLQAISVRIFITEILAIAALLCL